MKNVNAGAENKNPRALALRSLLALEKEGRFVNLEIDARLKNADFSSADRALYTRLVYGVTERKLTLDYIAGQFSKRPPREMDPEVLSAVRLGLYQLLYMDRIPDHAAVSETVGLLGGGRAGFVNAVLRAFLRAGKEYALPDPDDREAALSVKHSVPAALIRLYGTVVPGDEMDALLSAMNREPPVSLRVNPLRITPGEAAERVGGEISSLVSDIVKTDGLGEAARAGIEAGLWFVEDEASRIAAASVGARPGDRIADVCACPGGKTFSMALDMENRGEIFAFDLHENKLNLIRRGAEKLGIGIVTAEKRDARNPDPELVGRMDAVLCDAPCSGYGVIAKKPDLRYKDPASAEGLPRIQREILRGAAAYVRPGGTLVYSTCTLNRAENEEVVMTFLAENPAFRIDPCPLLPGGKRTFLPHRDGCDGFFAVRMKRIEE